MILSILRLLFRLLDLALQGIVNFCGVLGDEYPSIDFVQGKFTIPACALIAMDELFVISRTLRIEYLGWEKCVVTFSLIFGIEIGLETHGLDIRVSTTESHDVHIGSTREAPAISTTRATSKPFSLQNWLFSRLKKIFLNTRSTILTLKSENESCGYLQLKLDEVSNIVYHFHTIN